MVVKWQNGGPRRTVASLGRIEERLVDAAIDVMAQTVDEGAEDQARALDEAVTEYGAKRYAAGRGGSAGRNDTGHMIDEIEHGVERHGRSIIGWWGWDNPDPHDDEYFRIQESTAQSLWTSFIPTRERFRKRVSALVRGK